MSENEEKLNEKIKLLYNNLLNDEIQKGIMFSIIDGKDPNDIIEILIKRMEKKKR